MNLKTVLLCFSSIFILPNAHAQFVLSSPQNPHSQTIPACEIHQANDQQPFPCKAIVVFKGQTILTQRNAILSALSITKIKHFKYQNASALVIPNRQILIQLQSNSSVSDVIPDRPITIFAPPPGKGSGGGSNTTSGQVVPEGVVSISAAPGLMTQTGDQVGVAIVDTGIDLMNKDLHIGSVCFTRFNYCNDDNGHGTHVAGIVAAINNDIDVVGVAPNAVVYAVKSLDTWGYGSDSDVIAGLEWVYQNAANLNPQIKVVNMSLGRTGQVDDNPVFENAVEQLINSNIVVVVGAGNDSTVDVSQMIPAGYPNVISVASTTAMDGSNSCRKLKSKILPQKTASFFTTDGAGISISAPGEAKEDFNGQCVASPLGILSLKVGGGTIRKMGTSMAAPHVTGVVALMFEKNQALTSGDVKNIIEQSAEAIGIAPYDSPITEYVFDGVREGVVNAEDAVLNTP